MENLQEAYLSVYRELDEIRNPISRFLSNRKHKRRDTPEGHQEIMDRNREYQTKGKGPGGYRNKGAGRIEDTRKEEVDLFDYLLEYLVAEGYADTNENAIAIMANMSEEWREEILDEASPRISRSMGRRATQYRKDQEQAEFMRRVRIHQEKMKNDPAYRESHMNSLKTHERKPDN
jgi:hypothetical protein